MNPILSSHRDNTVLIDGSLEALDLLNCESLEDDSLDPPMTEAEMKLLQFMDDLLAKPEAPATSASEDRDAEISSEKTCESARLGAETLMETSDKVGIVPNAAALADTGTGEIRDSGPETPANPIEGIALLSQLKARRTDWLWHNRIPLGELTILDGDPGTNKSSLTIDLAARVSTGREMPDGTAGSEGGVVLLQGEDSLRKTLLPRLIAAAANLERIAASDDVRIPDELSRVEDAVQKVKAKLVVLDPLMCFLQLNANAEQSARRAMGSLRELAERYDLAIVLVRHLSKSGGKKALYRGMGSIAITAVVRCAFLVAPSPRDPNMRVLCHYKSNLGPTTSSLLFEPAEDDQGRVRIEWHGECEYSADDLLNATPGDSGARDEARKFLWKILADGPLPCRVIRKQIVARGLSERTAERAKADLGILSLRKGFGQGSQIFWQLPQPDPEEPTEPHSPPMP